MLVFRRALNIWLQPLAMSKLHTPQMTLFAPVNEWVRANVKKSKYFPRIHVTRVTDSQNDLG